MIVYCYLCYFTFSSRLSSSNNNHKGQEKGKNGMCYLVREALYQTLEERPRFLLFHASRTYYPKDWYTGRYSWCFWHCQWCCWHGSTWFWWQRCKSYNLGQVYQSFICLLSTSILLNSQIWIWNACCRLPLLSCLSFLSCFVGRSRASQVAEITMIHGDQFTVHPKIDDPFACYSLISLLPRTLGIGIRADSPSSEKHEMDTIKAILQSIVIPPSCSSLLVSTVCFIFMRKGQL